MTSKWEAMRILSPAVSGELKENVSLYDDCWGTVVGIEIRQKEDETEGRFYNQVVYTVHIDNTDLEFEESKNLPTDKDTGALAVDDAGNPVRPNKSSGQGHQEVLWNSIDVPWNGLIENIFGLHAHWLRKGVRRTRADINKEREQRAAGIKVNRPRDEVPYGRYVVEWDRYDNDVRKREGLGAITQTAAAKGTVKAEGVEVPVVDLLDGRTFVAAVREAREKGVATMPQRDEVNRLVSEGLLREDRSDDGVIVFRKVVV